MKLNKFYIENTVKNALNEDIGYEDITSNAIFNNSDKSKGIFYNKAKGIICGLDLIEIIYNLINPKIKVKVFLKEGFFCNKNQIKIAEVMGPTRDILTGERVVLNFLQHLSGIATQTKKFTKIADKYNVTIVDTRKTLPGLRYLQKYAVKVGGGKNHRIGLYDTILIKDNHIKAAGSISNAVKKVRKYIGHTIKIEVETKNLSEIKEALKNKVDIIMLDNFNFKDAKKMVQFINKKAITEISGNINLETLESYCMTGVDVISAGCLTHSVMAFDITLLFK